MPANRRASKSTACRICRQPAAPGEGLCGPCRSALKRARDSTVSEAMKPARRARSRPAAATPPVEAAAPAAPTRPANWMARGAFAAFAFGLFVAGGVWLAHTRGIAGTIAPRYAVAGPETGAETVQSATTTVALVAPAAVPVEKVAPPAPVEPDRPDPRSLPSTITLPRGNGAPAEAQPLAPAIVPPPVATPAIEAPLPAPVAVAAAPARPAPDRWQVLAEAIGRCPSRDLIAHALCAESLRLEHCEGHWGRVSACPAKVEREYGN